MGQGTVRANNEPTTRKMSVGFCPTDSNWPSRSGAELRMRPLYLQQLTANTVWKETYPVRVSSQSCVTVYDYDYDERESFSVMSGDLLIFISDREPSRTMKSPFAFRFHHMECVHITHGRRFPTHWPSCGAPAPMINIYIRFCFFKVLEDRAQLGTACARFHRDTKIAFIAKNTRPNYAIIGITH